MSFVVGSMRNVNFEDNLLDMVMTISICDNTTQNELRLRRGASADMFFTGIFTGSFEVLKTTRTVVVESLGNSECQERAKVRR